MYDRNAQLKCTNNRLLTEIFLTQFLAFIVHTLIIEICLIHSFNF